MIHSRLGEAPCLLNQNILLVHALNRIVGWITSNSCLVQILVSCPAATVCD